jgi:CheY-like chemotaxis protein
VLCSFLLADCGVDPIVRASASRHDRKVATLILIVDDNSHFRAIAVELLAALGFGSFGAVADGEQALLAVADSCPDGILLDVNLPGADGFAVAASLAAVCPAARIVLTSADADRVPPALLKASAAVAFVPKQQLAVTDLAALFCARTAGR